MSWKPAGDWKCWHPSTWNGHTRLAELPLTKGSGGDDPGIVKLRPREEPVGHGEAGQLRMKEHHLLRMGLEGL